MRHRPTKEQFQAQLEQMVLALRNDILNGVYAPGDHLPSEKSLVTRFGMSNNSIRLGLERLVEEGWIEKIPRVGNRVAAGRPPVKLKLLCSTMPIRNLKLMELLQLFQRRYPWITIEVVPISDSALLYRVEDESFPGDLIIFENNQYARLEADISRTLEPMEPRADLFPQATAMFQSENGLFLQPIIFSPLVLCYNRAHFREQGLLEPDGSWTWDDLMRNAELLSDGKSRYGFCFHIPTTNRWPVFLLQSLERFEWDGPELRDLRGTGLLKSMSICKRIIHNRKAFPLYLSESNDDIDRMFMEGKVSMTINSYMGVNGWVGSDVEYDFSPLPFIREQRTLAIALGIGMNRQCKQKEEAKLFVDFLVSEEAQSLIREQTLSLPCRGNMPVHIAETGLYRPSRYGLYRETMASMRTLSDLNISHKQLQIVYTQLKAYWADLIDEEELCDRLKQLLSASKQAEPMRP